MKMPTEIDPNEHPARKAARLSRTYYAQRKKKEWLDLWAENGEVRDPLGKSWMDPDGVGFATPEAREKWWDRNSDNLEFYYSMLASFAAGNSVANYESIIIVVNDNGEKSSFKCEGIWTYSVDDEGKLTTMYGYWEEKSSMESKTSLPGHQFYVE